MKIIAYIERINTIHKLIKECKTGNPETFARKLSICTSRLYTLLDEFKLMDAPIEYSRQMQSYYYTQPFEVRVEANFRLLKSEETKQIDAGTFFQKSDSLFFL